MTAFYTILIGLGALSAAIISVRQVVLPIKQKIRIKLDWLDSFMRDWSGEEEEPGRDRVPGVMERLNSLDGELKRNGGSSTKDVVVQLNEKFDVLATAVLNVNERLESIENYLQPQFDDTEE